MSSCCCSRARRSCSETVGMPAMSTEWFCAGLAILARRGGLGVFKWVHVGHNFDVGGELERREASAWVSELDEERGPTVGRLFHFGNISAAVGVGQRSAFPAVFDGGEAEVARFLIGRLPKGDG